MNDYYIGEWTTGGMSKGVAQSANGSRAIESYAGVGVGSGKIMLSMTRISESEFERNKARGVKTV